MHAGEEREPPKRIRDDARLADELAYCVPLGIPHSVFLSWDVDDQDKALAWRAEQSLRCSCGTRPDEWDPKQGGSRVAYLAQTRQCLGCEELARGRRDAPEGELGVVIYLEKNPDA